MKCKRGDVVVTRLPDKTAHFETDKKDRNIEEKIKSNQICFGFTHSSSAMSCLHCSARCQDLSFGKSINSTKCDLYCQAMNFYQSYTSWWDAWSLFSSCEWHSLQRCGKEGLTTQRYDWLSANAVLCMNNRGQYNTGEKLIYTIRCFIFLSVSHFAPFLSAPHLISVFFPQHSVSSPSLCMSVFLSLCTRARTPCSNAINIHAHTEGDPCTSVK